MLRSPWLLSLCVVLQPIIASATAPPRAGTSNPQAYYDRLAHDPEAFQFRHGFIALTKKARENREAKKNGAQPLGLIDKVSGHRRVLILLLQYSDSKTVPYRPEELARQLFGHDSPRSLSTYYRENSYGSLDLTGDVVPWKRLSHNETYYAGRDPKCYGTCDNSKVTEMVEEAVRMNDSQIQWGLYDNDGIDGVANTAASPRNHDDGVVDFVAIVHPGRGAECDKPLPTSLWSHHSRLTSWQGHAAVSTSATNYNGKGGKIRVDDYVLFPAVACDGATPIQIGVIAHEIGHALGLPDLYDTSKAPESEGLGNWDLMAGGSWGGDGNSPEQPTHMSEWSKAYLGWVNPKDVTADTSHVTLRPFETTGDVLLLTIKRDLTAGINQYYLISNRQRHGFDSKIPGTGLLILHVDETVLKKGLSTNRVNVNPNSLGVAVIEADGLNQLIHQPGSHNVFDGGPGDTFPGATGKTVFDNRTVPGTAGRIAICSIATTSTIVILDLAVSRGTCALASQASTVVSVKMLSQTPRAFVNLDVRVTGTLTNEAQNYFREPLRLFLSDHEGYKIRVAPWAPLEFPSGRKSDGPPTISQFLDETVELTGALRAAQDETPWIFHVRHVEILR